MSWILRVLLFLGSLFMACFVLKRIRKSRMLVENAIFWIFLALVLVILSIFPNIAIYTAEVLGVQSPANLVFLVVLCLLIFKLFALVSKVEKIQKQVIQLTQQYAIDAKNRENASEDTYELI